MTIRIIEWFQKENNWPLWRGWIRRCDWGRESFLRSSGGRAWRWGSTCTSLLWPENQREKFNLFSCILFNIIRNDFSNVDDSIESRTYLTMIFNEHFQSISFPLNKFVFVLVGREPSRPRRWWWWPGGRWPSEVARTPESSSGKGEKPTRPEKK